MNNGVDIYDRYVGVIFLQINQDDPAMYNMLRDTYVLNQLPGYIEACLHS